MKKGLKFLRIVIDFILFAIVLFALILQIGKWQKKIFAQAYKEALNNHFLAEKIIEGKKTLKKI